jgi:hypothetical protein
MKRAMVITVTMLIVASFMGTALATPRLQTYIVGSDYYVRYGRLDRWSNITNTNQFDLKVVGYWNDYPAAGSYQYDTYNGMDMAPTYDYMDCYLAMSVSSRQSGTIWVNGVEISSFNGYFNALPSGATPSYRMLLSRPSLSGRYNFHNVGRIDNDQVGAHHYGYGHLLSAGWGDEILLNVVVRGFDWAHFDAIGIDSNGRTWTNSQNHDSSYFAATPEPSTISLLGLGLLGIAPLLRRKKK